jgi:hypothetical protein
LNPRAPTSLPDIPGSDGSWLPDGVLERLLSTLLLDRERRLLAQEVLGAPLVGAALVRLGRPDPGLAKATIAAAVMGRATRARAMRLVAELDRQGIGCVALKGFATGAWLYPHPAFRPLPDVDLLVRDADLARLATLLKGDGWATRPEHLTVRRWGALTKASFAPVAPPEGALLLDIHREVDDRPACEGLPAGEIFRNAGTLALPDGTLRVPDAGDTFAILALHAFRDFYEPRGLKGLIDAALLLARQANAIDWADVERRAVAGCYVRRIVLYRALLRAATGAEVPVFERRLDAGLARWAERFAGAMRTLARTRLPDRDKVVVEAQALDGWRDVARLYARRLSGLVARKDHTLPGVPVALV